jgi:hypothetical protein
MTIIQLAVLLSCVIHLCIGGRADIPPNLLAQLKSVQFNGDIPSIDGVRIVPMPTNRTPSSHSRKLLTGSVINNDVSGGGSGGGGSNSNMGERVEVIRDPKQASNSCLQRNICVPVPVDDQDASVFVFPQCIELPQCLGSCCDSLQRCHPEHVVPVMVEVRYIRIRILTESSRAVMQWRL